VKNAHHFTAPFDNLTIAAQESGTYRGRRQSRQAWGRRRLCCLWLYGNAARYFDPLQAAQIDPGCCWTEDVPAFASSQGNQRKISKIKLAISAMAITPATESTNAWVAAW
jgi:hypothetical protein